MNFIETEMTILEAKIKDVEAQDFHCAPLILLLMSSKDRTSSDGLSKLNLLWVHDDDHNTISFHNSVHTQNHHTNISHISDHNGNLYSDRAGVEHAFLLFILTYGLVLVI